MGLFGNGQNKRVDELQKLVFDLDALVRSLVTRVAKAETAASEAAERAYRYMKKAEARARRELDEPNQEPDPAAGPETPAPSSSLRAWGARGRRLARSLRRDPMQDTQLFGAGHSDKRPVNGES